MDDFSEHPPTLGEIRSEKSERACDWTPREALISLLREIDAGRVIMDALVISYREPTTDGIGRTRFVCSSQDPLISLGLLTRAAYRIQVTGEQ